MNMGEVTALFLNEKAPKDPDFAKTCDADYKKIQKATQSTDELEEGIVELVKNDPVSYHWCFYAKLLELEKFLKNNIFLDQKQKAVLDAYTLLTPAARAYLRLFHDSRYLHWASYKYKKMSEWVFFRKLEMTPAGTVELVQPINPFGLWRDTEAAYSILEKYHILKEAAAEATAIASSTEKSKADQTPKTEQKENVREPASASASSPSPDPAASPATLIAPAPQSEGSPQAGVVPPVGDPSAPQAQTAEIAAPGVVGSPEASSVATSALSEASANQQPVDTTQQAVRGSDPASVTPKQQSVDAPSDVASAPSAVPQESDPSRGISSTEPAVPSHSGAPQDVNASDPQPTAEGQPVADEQSRVTQ
jgi:hypothetical protein